MVMVYCSCVNLMWFFHSIAYFNWNCILFPGLPTVQVLITCGFCILQAIKNWTVGRPGNEAIANASLKCLIYSVNGMDHLINSSGIDTYCVFIVDI